MCKFSKSDVLRLAKAVLDEPIEYSGGDYRSYYFCNFCDAELDDMNNKIENFKHDLNCPVLIAQDISTRMTLDEDLEEDLEETCLKHKTKAIRR